MIPDVLIVGAGISGLLAGRRLTEAGRRVVVLDKGRGVGGRMATRRVGLNGTGTAVFDHGAQFFTVRDPRFADLVAEWRAAGVVEPWSRGFPTSDAVKLPAGHARYRGATGMTAVPKHLARDLDVRLETRVDAVGHEGNEWWVRTAEGDALIGRALLLTPPVPQTRSLLEESGITLPEPARRALGRARYDPCFALLVVLAGRSAVPAPGGLLMEDDVLSWIGDNQQKGISEVPALTLHATYAFSGDQLEADRDTVAARMLEAARPWLGAPVIEQQLHLWRYSMAARPPGPRAVYAATPLPLVVAGDGLAGPFVEAAALSGLEAAERLLGPSLL